MADVVTVIATALGAVVIFVLTQSFLKLVLEPVQEQRKLIGEVAHALLFYANVVPAIVPPDIVTDGEEMTVGSGPEEVAEARKALLGLAGQLRASLWTIPFYDLLARIRWVRSKEDVIQASTQLAGWSDSLSGNSGGRHKRRTIIADRLGITEKLDPSRPPRTDPT